MTGQADDLPGRQPSAADTTRGQVPGGAPYASCAVLPAGLVVAYAEGRLADPAAWSVEAHVPGCLRCRAELAEGQNTDRSLVDRDRLARNGATLRVRLALGPPGPGRRLLLRCGVPDEVIALLTVTPSLRRSWLAGIALVLIAALGVAWAAPAALGPAVLRPAMAASALVAPGHVIWALVPYLVLAPLLPLGAVAIAFSTTLDPAYQLAIAAPMPKARLLLVRSVAVICATLIPTVLVALMLPGPWWVPAAILLSDLALCVAALAAATVTGPARATIGAGVAWLGVVAGAGLAAGNPVLVFSWDGQLSAFAVLMAAVVVLIARRRKIDPAWMR